MRISDWSSDVCSSDLAQASAGVGTYGTSQYKTSIAGAKDGWTYSLGSSYEQSHGYNATNHNAGNSYNPDKDSHYSRNLNGSLGYEWQKDQTLRSEERRVGKEWVRTGRSRWTPYHKKKKKH